MNTLSRKQREIADRHAMLLDIGRSLLVEEGFHNVSMERIAELAEYSKGTVYQHFSCKEEILVQLCNDSMTQLLSIFEHARAYPGTHRDRMLALIYAHFLWSELNPVGMSMLQHMSMHGVKEKVSELSMERHTSLEKQIFGCVVDIVESAIHDGQLVQPEQQSVPNIVFGLWSMCFGGQILTTTHHVDLQMLGINNPQLALMRMGSVTMDGLNWMPLHNQTSFIELQTKYQEYFNSEAGQLAANRTATSH